MKSYHLLLICIGLFVISSCSSDLEFDFDNSEQELEFFDYLDYDNPTVLPGYCVIGSIQYAGIQLNIYYPTLLIELALEGYAVRDPDGHLIGLSMSSYDWNTALSYFFNVEYPQGQNSVISAILNGQPVICRINGRTHAVVLTGVDLQNNKFYAYDSTANTPTQIIQVNFGDVQDPRILSHPGY